MVTKNAIIAAFSSTALISLAPNVLLLLFPRFASGEGHNSPALSLGQCLAAGGLLGDVFLHVVPHSGGSHNVGLWILLGFSVFLLTDMILRTLGGDSHGHNHGNPQKENEPDDKKCDANSPLGDTKTSTILLNLTADAMHNFSDGVAIGASFSNFSGGGGVLDIMKTRGGLATLSILFHEIPHELGDFAVLVKNGFSKQDAIIAQFGTAFAAMIGTSVGLLAEQMAGDSLVFITSGGFVYLATVNILPDVLNEKASLRFRLAQLLFFGLGVAFLYAVCLLEEMDGGHGHGHGHHEHDEHHEEHHDEPVHNDHHDEHHDLHDHGHRSHGHHHGEL